jgi:hypothetical protein
MTEFLESMSTEIPGLYVLGSLNWHITVHSQQCRAINLIRSLMGDGRALDDKSLAIVGAGFAGLTAAAYAVEKTTAKVTLIDAAPRPLWIQDSCANRWLHPGIYDWPYAGSLEPCTALPVLNWRAGSARDVARRVRAEFDRIVTTKALLTVLLEKHVRSVNRSDDSLLLDVDGEQMPFGLVVLATGFGLESGGPCRIGYWNDSDGLDDIAPGESVLISGFGDGGLADVLRLCLPEIRQASLVELIRHVPVEVCHRLIEADSLNRFDGSALDRFYENLRIESIIKRLQKTAAQLGRITLSGRDHLYGTGSAILNRFLVSQLWQVHGEKAFAKAPPVVPDSIQRLPDGRVQVRFESVRDLVTFDHVVVRWGPQPTYSRVDPLSRWRAGAERRKHWFEMPQSLDRTRVLLKEVGDSQTLAEKQSQDKDFLAYESSSRRWCLILKPSTSTADWKTLTNQALEACAVEHDLNVEPLERVSTDALRDETTVRNIVRALCAADIVVADVTKYDPELMFLLGIRAAVRRSITIACTSVKLTQTQWQKLPFNLRELNLLSFANKADGWRALRDTIREGLAQSSSTRYLDLPVYDYVRDEPPAVPDVRRQPILFLRPFGEYEEERLIFVQNRLEEAFGGDAEVTVESVIDQKSPRLASQRLYEAIRHWARCVVDLTLWRPNVMFELGVRLATHPKGTYYLFDSSAPGHKNSMAAKHLLEFLRPFQYDFESSFKAAFTNSAMAPDIIYETANRHFRTSQDHYDETAEDLLLASASVASGQDDPLQAVDIRPLYAIDNMFYGQSIRHSAFEKLCAAWVYLADRSQPHHARPIELLDEQREEVFRRFFQLGARLKNGLGARQGRRDRELRRRIANAERIAMVSGATTMAGLIAAWRDIRRAGLWREDGTELTEQERLDLVGDCEDQVSQLRELERHLEALSNPVCQLPLEAVQADRSRIEIAIRRINGGNDV